MMQFGFGGPHLVEGELKALPLLRAAARAGQNGAAGEGEVGCGGG